MPHSLIRRCKSVKLSKKSSRFLKKAAQKLLQLWGMGVLQVTPMPQSDKSLFASFSTEKEVLPSYAPTRRACRAFAQMGNTTA